VGGKLRSFILLGFLIFSGASAGCKLNILPGHYQGTWSSQNQVQAVDIEVVQVSKKKGSHGRVTQANGDVLIDLYFSKKKRDQIQLKIPKLNHLVLDLVKTGRVRDPLRNQECYASRFPVVAELCWDDHDFQLDLKSNDPSQAFTLSAGEFFQIETKEQEPEKDFTLSEMVKLLLSQNAEINVELQHLDRVRQNALLSYLDLLPHVRFSTGPAIASVAATMSPFGVINEAGNLTPFLLPDRWIRPWRMKSAKRAQEQGFRVVRANAIFLLESLVYTLLGHERVERLYHRVFKDVEEILSQVEFLEGQKRIKKGSYENLRDLHYQLSVQRSQVIASLQESRASLALILGINNPRGIRSVTVDHEYIPQHSTPVLNEEKLKQAVLLRAPELKQMDHFISNAKVESIELFFLWLDPSSAPNMTLGFNWIPQYSSARSIVRELKVKKREIESQLKMKSTSTVSKYNSILRDFERMETYVEFEERRLQEVKVALLQAVSQKTQDPFQLYSAFEIKEMIQETLLAKSQQESRLNEFQMKRLQINRLLLIEDQHFLNSENQGDELLTLFSEDVKVGNPRLE
jgi:hypothetical protein